MANGNIYDLDFSNIYGAQGGGQDLQNVMNTLLESLYTSQYFGVDTEAGSQYGANWETPSGVYFPQITEGYSPSDPFGIWGENPPSLENEGLDPMSSASGMQDYLDWYTQHGFGGESTENPGAWGGLTQGMSALQDLFEKLNIPGLTQGYAQDIGDVQTQMGSKIEGLESAYAGRKGKSQRYGGIGTGGRPSGSRSDYLSDYYGLTDEMAQMQQSLQGGVVDDFRGGMADWLGTMTPGGYI